MRELITPALLYSRPIYRHFSQVFEIGLDPNSFCNKIYLDDRTNFFRAIKFLSTTYAYIFVINGVGLAMMALFHKVYGAEFDAPYYDEIAAVFISMIILVVFGFVNFLLFKLFKEKRLTLRNTWHIYALVVGSASMMLTIYSICIVIAKYASILLVIQFCESCDKSTGDIIDLWIVFTIIIVMIYILLRYCYIYAYFVDNKMSISKYKTFIVVIISYPFSVLLIHLSVIAFDSVTNMNIYAHSGLDNIITIYRAFLSLI